MALSRWSPAWSAWTQQASQPASQPESKQTNKSILHHLMISSARTCPAETPTGTPSALWEIIKWLRSGCVARLDERKTLSGRAVRLMN